MRTILHRHPDSACEAVAAIAVEIERTGSGGLTLRYLVTATPDRLVVPPPAEPVRVDGLWRHTCFEAFVRAPGVQPYAELNLAPSGQWAAYAFDGYRQAMRPAELAAPPAIAWVAHPDGFELTAGLDLSVLAPSGAWRIGLSAVIEEAGGRTSYWALAHPPGKADFHHDDGFALTLSGPPPQ